MSTHIAESPTGRLHLTHANGYTHGVRGRVLGEIGAIAVDEKKLCGTCLREEGAAAARNFEATPPNREIVAQSRETVARMRGLPPGEDERARMAEAWTVIAESYETALEILDPADDAYARILRMLNHAERLADMDGGE